MTERAKVQLKQMKIAKFDVGDCFKSTSALTATLAELITHMCDKDEEERRRRWSGRSSQKQREEEEAAKAAAKAAVHCPLFVQPSQPASPPTTTTTITTITTMRAQLKL